MESEQKTYPETRASESVHESYPGRRPTESVQKEPDLPPEYCHYQDDGCEFANSCLNCPFAKCIYDEPRGRQRYIQGLRNKEILRLFTTEGKGIKELALMFGISQRTVQRALKRTRNEFTPKTKIFEDPDE